MKFTRWPCPCGGTAYVVDRAPGRVPRGERANPSVTTKCDKCGTTTVIWPRWGSNIRDVTTSKKDRYGPDFKRPG